MVVFLRSRRRPCCLFALALFAWLMLAAAPFGAGMGMASPQQTPEQDAHASHALMHMDDTGCCTDRPGQLEQHATLACHCALPCAGVLPSTPARLAALPAIPADYAPPRPIEAPVSGFAPPLRPPLA